MDYFLTKEEYKKLVIDVAIKISPVLIESSKSGSVLTGENISLYARDIADSVELVIKQKYD